MADDTNTAERDALMDLIDAYAEARHVGGCHTYNAKTAEARAKVVASLAASAGSEPVAEIGSASGDDAEFGQRAVYPLVDIDHLEYGTKLYTHPSPPEGMVGGWIASKDQMPPPGVRVFWGDVDSHRVGYDSWAGDDYRWAPSHWMHIPEFAAPPTSSADSGKGE